MSNKPIATPATGADATPADATPTMGADATLEYPVRLVGFATSKAETSNKSENKSENRTKRMKKKEHKPGQRMIAFRAYVDGTKEQFLAVLRSIRAYRMLLNNFIGKIAMAQAASSVPKLVKDQIRIEIDRKQRAEYLLLLSELARDAEETPARHGVARYYELRPAFVQKQKDAEVGEPIFHSHVWDALRQELQATWDKDIPELKMPRSIFWGTGEHKLPEMLRTGLPVMCCTTSHPPRVYARMVERDGKILIEANWDKSLGWVSFVIDGPYTINGETKIAHPNPGHKMVIKKILSGEWPMQTIVIKKNKKDQLTILVPHRRTVDKEAPGDGILDVFFSPRKGHELPDKARWETNHAKTYVIHYRKHDYACRVNHFDVDDILRMLDIHEIKMRKQMLYKSTCKGPHRHREAIQERISRLTDCRHENVKYWNNVWSIRLAKIAKEWQCGTIRIYGLPPGAVINADPTQGLVGRTWDWKQFLHDVQYKAERFAIKVEQIGQDLEMVTKALSLAKE